MTSIEPDEILAGDVIGVSFTDKRGASYEVEYTARHDRHRFEQAASGAAYVLVQRPDHALVPSKTTLGWLVQKGDGEKRLGNWACHVDTLTCDGWMVGTMPHEVASFTEAHAVPKVELESLIEAAALDRDGNCSDMYLAAVVDQFVQAVAS